jgi:TonB-linked SusC/RagA family outer membrane protein
MKNIKVKKCFTLFKHQLHFFSRSRYQFRLLSVVMMLTCFCSISAQSINDKITFGLNNQSLEKGLQQVAKLSGFHISYAIPLVSKYENVTVTKGTRTVGRTLDLLLSNTDLKYVVMNKNIVINQKNSTNRNMRVLPRKHSTNTVSGTVTDEDGEPLLGVAVREDGSSSGVITDSKGYFQLPMDADNATLLITYVGKKDLKIKVQRGSALKILLEDNVNVLGEVVVTGYQDIQKGKMTGSAVTITADKLNDRYTPNLLNNLEGRVAGLSTYGGKLTIRGTSSLYAEASPLLVVDGLPVEGQIEDLNPYDIESVNVLKDAAATAIYGARASNGIIVITTKNAKEKNKINIDFTTNFTIYEKKNMDYSDNFYMTPSQQVDTESAYYEYYYFNNNGEISDPMSSVPSLITRGISLTPIQYAYYQLAKGDITRDQLNSTLDKYRKNNYAQDYADNLLRRQIIQQYNLALRSRSEHSSQNLTINYKYDNTGKQNSYQNQFNINYKGSFDLAKWMTATFTVNGTFGRSKTPATFSFLSVWDNPAYYSIYDENGDYSWNNSNYYGNSYNSYEKDSHYRSMRYNPKEDLTNDVTNTRSQNMRYHVDLLFKIIDGLTLDTKFIYETMNGSSREYANSNSFEYRRYRNAYTQEENGTYTYLIPESGGMLRTKNTDGDYWTWRGQLNFNRTFGKHTINVLGGLEFRDTKYKGVKGLLLGYDDQLQISNTAFVDFGALNTTYGPSFYNGGFYTQLLYQDLISALDPISETHHRYASGYFTSTYTYDERYNVFFSFRKDYADVYGLNAKFRGKPLWSIGVAWNINNETFMKSLKWVDYLKLRASYGVTGNIYQGATSYMTASIDGNNIYTKLPLATVESPANPELKWEQTRTTNIGIDFSLLNDRLRGSIDYYHKIGKDLFSYKSLDPSKGYTKMFMNSANMKNDGIEMQFTYDWFLPSKSDRFRWNTSFTLSYNKNKITRVDNDATIASQLINNPYKVGYPSSALWSFKFAGIDSEADKGSTLWYTSDGNKAHRVSSSGIGALEYSGQSEPKVIMGMNNSWKFRGFSLSVLLTYYGGHKMRALAENEIFDVPSTAIPSYFLKAWTPENPTNTPGIGRYSAKTTGMETTYGNIAVRPADFIKIRNLVLGYDLPNRYLTKLGIQHVSLRVQIDNPKYLWIKNKVHVDPETLGIRQQSAYIFGLNINI